MTNETVMNDDSLKERILKTYTTDQKRSKIGRLRKQFSTIEAVLDGGTSIDAVVQTLNDSGLTLTRGTFIGYMHILRKENTEVNTTQPKTILTKKQTVISQNITKGGTKEYTSTERVNTVDSIKNTIRNTNSTSEFNID